ncbi:unnamed protein product [Orchesella dallaii]|uniref:Cytochrome b561 domain-containing protein n=1 Tax=Orchesella dallaii TaxID=48710 RepID=A0ABP1S9P9_9HEXA
MAGPSLWCWTSVTVVVFLLLLPQLLIGQPPTPPPWSNDKFCDPPNSAELWCEVPYCRRIEERSKNDPVCSITLEDGPDSWLYPDRLWNSEVTDVYFSTNNDHPDWHRDHWCCRPDDNNRRWRIGIRSNLRNTENEGTSADELDIGTNRLRFDASVIAQEGHSFCIIGRHYRRSKWQYWAPLRGFSKLADKSFDIGNHIDPEDSGRMNSFTLPDPDAIRNLYKKGVWGQPSNWPEHEWRYVFLGQRRDNRLDRWCFGNGNVGEGYPLIEGYKKRPAHPEYQPDPTCKNPYKVSVTMIKADEHTLHNYLHIKVFSEPTSQPQDKNCPTGKFKLLMLEVRDQDGLPVGQFTDDIPCEQDKKTMAAPCTSGSVATGDAEGDCIKLVGSNKNQVPCMFTHPKSPVHPTIFMAAAEEGQSGGGGSGGGQGGEDKDACRDSTKPQSERKPPTITHTAPESYFTEVHATWRYAQHNAGWVSELHFATMIIEDDSPIQYYTSRKTEWFGPSPCVIKHYRKTDYILNDKCGQYYWYEYETYYIGIFPFYRLKEHSRPIYCGHPGRASCWYFKQDGHNSDTRCGRIQLALLNVCVNATYNSNRPYGYSARYTALKPTWRTRGGWDFFQKRFIRPSDVDCHVDIPYGDDYYYNLKDAPGTYSKLPVRRTLKNFVTDHYTLDDPRKYPQNGWEIPDYHTPGKYEHIHFNNREHPQYNKKMEWHYHGSRPEIAILKMFRSAHQDPITVKTEFPDFPAEEYFGSNYLEVQSDPPPNSDVSKLQNKHPKGDGAGELDKLDNIWSLSEMVENGKTRCPCQFVPTTPLPELQTKRSVEIEGRRSHVVQMLIGWVILVPLSFFVARFYKETFSKVFFLQEFWWYTIHVICLLTTLMFTIGGIYALKVKRSLGPEYEIVWTDATTVHIYFGYGLMGTFIAHLLFGFFRAYDVDMRMIQMSLHWGFGWLEYAVANAVILSAMAIPSGILNCISLVIYIVFLMVQLAFTIGMEIHMRNVDKELNLSPPRSYLPTPVMRIFHRDAPHSYFRMVILGIFFLVCVAFYTAIHLTMDFGSEFSCFQPS